MTDNSWSFVKVGPPLARFAPPVAESRYYPSFSCLSVLSSPLSSHSSLSLSTLSSPPLTVPLLVLQQCKSFRQSDYHTLCSKVMWENLERKQKEVDYLLLCKIFAKYSTHSGFRRLCVCVCVSVCVSDNFLLYSITKTILPGSSPHLLRTFLLSIPSFLLILGSFRKTRWRPCLFFYSISSHWLSIGD